ncbi:MAG: DUF971 domain-containing protein [Ignavibacteriales bacterium]|nr:DUF971 domain-containing protein [Ignavibacteriales bacterium]
MIPVKLSVTDKKFLDVKWDDDTETRIKLANLRMKCPCAACSSERAERGEKYIPIYSDEELTIKEIKIIGNYAVEIIWKDGHDTGIYEFGYLKKISN